MRRTWWYRPFATLLIVWLPLILGEPSLLQPCPMHGSVLVANSAATSGQHAGHHAAVAAHSEHHLAEAAGQHSAPDHQHHTCSCIGCCAGSPAIVPTFEGPSRAIVVAAYDVATTPVEAAALPRPAPEYARPYNTGPPRV